MTPKEMRDRLRYIHKIASGQVMYASDFGRICTIERASNLRLSVTKELADHRWELRQHDKRGSTTRRARKA